MKRLTTIFLSLVVAATAFGQAAKPESTALPTVDQVLDKYVKALGGKEAIMKITTRHQKGTFEIPSAGMGGPAEFYLKAPNKVTVTIDIGGYGIVREGYNGSAAWSQSPDAGLRDKTATELADSKVDHDFYKDIRLKELYPGISVKGKEKVGARDAYVLVGPRGAGKSNDLFYFDTESGLLIRADVEREGPEGKVAAQIYYEDYKEVNGVKEPYTFRRVTPMVEFMIKFSEIIHNVPIDDAKFNKPAAQ